MSNKKLSKQEQLEVAFLYKNGYKSGEETYKSLSEKYGVHEREIHKALKEYKCRKKDLEKNQGQQYSDTELKRENKSTNIRNARVYNNNIRVEKKDFNYRNNNSNRNYNCEKNYYDENEDDYKYNNQSNYRYYNGNYNIDIYEILKYMIPIMICSLIISLIFPSPLKKDIKINTVELKNGQYIGQSILKRANGYGRAFMDNNDKYIGKFKNNKINGVGTLILDDTYELVGNFESNKVDGLFVSRNRYNENETFIGYYKNGKKNGIGVNINGLDFNIYNYKNNNPKDEIANGNFAYSDSVNIIDEDSGFSVINHEGRVFISKLKNKEFNGFTLSFGYINDYEMLDITVDDYERKKSITQITFNNINDYHYINKKDVVNKDGSVFYIGKLRNNKFNGLGIQYNYDLDKQYANIGYYDKNILKGKVYTIDKVGSLSVKKR